MPRLAFRLDILDELAPFVHFVLDVLNDCFPLGLNRLFNLLLEVVALRVVLGNVF